MGFVWTEIKKWAKSKGMEASKTKDGLYHFDEKKYENLDLLATAIFNKITDNKWIKYQEDYQNNQTK